MINQKKVKVMELSSQVEIDPILAEAFNQMFDWGNRHGIKGRRLSNLRFEKQEDGRISVSCYEFVESKE